MCNEDASVFVARGRLVQAKYRLPLASASPVAPEVKIDGRYVDLFANACIHQEGGRWRLHVPRCFGLFQLVTRATSHSELPLT